jgi:hypothetical protein
MGTFGSGELICTYKYCERRSPLSGCHGNLDVNFGRSWTTASAERLIGSHRVAVPIGSVADHRAIASRNEIVDPDTQRPCNFLERANYFRVMLNRDSLHSLQAISLPSRNLAPGDRLRLGFVPLRKMIV